MMERFASENVSTISLTRLLSHAMIALVNGTISLFLLAQRDTRQLDHTVSLIFLLGGESSMFQVRLATPDDIDTLVQLRLVFLQELGTLPPDSQRERFAKATDAYIREKLLNGEFLAWVAESEGRILGTSGLVFFGRPPVKENFSGQEAYIMNMYTCPEYRGQGIATALLREILLRVKQTGGRRIWLHTTEAGKPLYEKTGFVSSTSEMELLW